MNLNEVSCHFVGSVESEVQTVFRDTLCYFNKLFTWHESFVPVELTSLLIFLICCHITSFAHIHLGVLSAELGLEGGSTRGAPSPPLSNRGDGVGLRCGLHG